MSWADFQDPSQLVSDESQNSFLKTQDCECQIESCVQASSSLLEKKKSEGQVDRLTGTYI